MERNQYVVMRVHKNENENFEKIVKIDVLMVFDDQLIKFVKHIYYIA